MPNCWCGHGLHSAAHLLPFLHALASSVTNRKAFATAELCPTLTNMLVIIVGGIPIAMPTVLSVTLALGAYKLARVRSPAEPA